MRFSCGILIFNFTTKYWGFNLDLNHIQLNKDKPLAIMKTFSYSSITSQVHTKLTNRKQIYMCVLTLGD